MAVATVAGVFEDEGALAETVVAPTDNVCLEDSVDTTVLVIDFFAPIEILLEGAIALLPRPLATLPLSAGTSFLVRCRLRFAGVPPLWRRFPPPLFLPLPPGPDFGVLVPPLLAKEDDKFELLAVVVPGAPAMSIPST